MSTDVMPAARAGNHDRLMEAAREALPEYMRLMRADPQKGRDFAHEWAMRHGDPRRRSYLLAAHINHIRGQA